MWIRYVALTDDSQIGRDAALYCDALVATGIPVRLVPARVAELQVDAGGRCHSVWDRHRGLLVTPIVGPFVNVVCSEVADWARYYTEGVTNALLLTASNFGTGQLDTVGSLVGSLTTITKYERVYAPSRVIMADIMRMADVTSAVVPIGTPGAATSFSDLVVF